MDFRKAEETMNIQDVAISKKYEEKEGIQYYFIRGICPKCGSTNISEECHLKWPFSKGPDTTTNYKCNKCNFTYLLKMYYC